MQYNLEKPINADYTPFLDRLRAYYAAMDRQYNHAAAYYGFDCNACKDNCCQTRFYHHTHIEYVFILEGFKTLGPERQIEIRSRALEICQASTELDKKGKPVRLMCPLNFENLCILYSYRPMICRLHGIPHELRKSVNSCVYGPGCVTFERGCSEKSYLKFDRTSFYVEMAALEHKFKQTAGIAGKIKLTIAEMIAGEKL